MSHVRKNKDSEENFSGILRVATNVWLKAMHVNSVTELREITGVGRRPTHSSCSPLDPEFRFSNLME